MAITITLNLEPSLSNLKRLATSKKKSEHRKATFRPSVEITKITSFVKNRVRGAGAKGIVLGISGGIDSAVVASLCVKAIGAEKVTITRSAD